MGLTPVNAVTNTQLQAIVWGLHEKENSKPLAD